MKRGKEVKLNIKENYNTISGTVDNKNPKSIYISVSAWGKPNLNEDIDYTKVIAGISKSVKQSLSKHINKDRFIKDRFIIDLDMRESGIKFEKRSYMNCEITLFQRQDINNLPVTSEELIEDITQVSDSILDEVFEGTDYFTFYKTKK
jgi:DNA mismatch repair ATPase MutS